MGWMVTASTPRSHIQHHDWKDKSHSYFTRHYWLIMKWRGFWTTYYMCTYRLDWARRTPEDGEMMVMDGDMTLPYSRRMRNSNPGGLRPSTLPLVTEAPHNIESSRVSGKEIFCWRPEWGSSPRPPTFQAGRFYICTRSPHLLLNISFKLRIK